MPKIKRIDHIAIAVEDIDQALVFWRDALGLPFSHTEQVPAQKAQVAFLPVQGSEVELVRPTEADTGVARFLQKRGPGMHHICFEVDDIEGCLAQLKASGVRLIDETPAIGSGGRRIAFIHPESTQGVLVELNEALPAVSESAPGASVREWLARLATESRALAAAGLAFVQALQRKRTADPGQPPVVLEERGEDG